MTQNWTGGRFLSGSFRFSNPNILRTNNSSRSERLSPFEGGGRDERERLSSSIYLSNELLISMRYPISPSNPRSFRRIWSGRPTTMTRSISRAIAICAALTPPFWKTRLLCPPACWAYGKIFGCWRINRLGYVMLGGHLINFLANCLCHRGKIFLVWVEKRFLFSVFLSVTSKENVLRKLYPDLFACLFSSESRSV